MQKLDKCPFCGGNVILEYWDEENQCQQVWTPSDEEDGAVFPIVVCHNCDCSICFDGLSLGNEVIKAYNTRKDAKIVMGLDKALEKDLERVSYRNSELEKELGETTKKLKEMLIAFTVATELKNLTALEFSEKLKELLEFSGGDCFEICDIEDYCADIIKEMKGVE